MTPQELDLILTSSQAINEDPDGFSTAFYDTVFDIAPAARSLFPTDIGEQRKKLVKELRYMVGAATAWADPVQLDAFVARTQDLGQRHVSYGVTTAMYEPVGIALISTLRDAVDDFGDEHEQAWTKLFGLISETMQEGAAMAAPVVAKPEPRRMKPARGSLAFALASFLVLLGMLGMSTSPAFAQDASEELPAQVYEVDDVESPTQGSGGGGEPEAPAEVPAIVASDDEGAGNVDGAATNTRTLTRTKKIPGAAFTGGDVLFQNGCAYPSNGNTPIYAPVTGLPEGATVTTFFVEGYNDPTESESFVAVLRWNDGDGGTTAMAAGIGSGAGYINATDSTIVDPVINGLGASGRSYYVVFDASNVIGTPDIDLDDHRICHVWITYEITETYLTDVFDYQPEAPCAEFDSRAGQLGYNAAEGGTMTVGQTRTIDINGASADCINKGVGGYAMSVFLVNVSGTNWLNVYDCELPDNDEAIIVGSPADALESVSLFVPDGNCSGGGDIKLTLGGSPGAQADVKIVLTGTYRQNDQPANRYAD